MSDFNYVPQEDLLAQIPAGGVAVQLSNFSFVHFERKGKPTSRKLRFTTVIQVDHPTLGALAVGLDGCLAHKTPEGVLLWGPALTRVNPYKALKTTWVNDSLYNVVCEALSKTEYMDALGTNWEESKERDPRNVNPDLPGVVDVV